jgi:hypothetical protein
MWGARPKVPVLTGLALPSFPSGFPAPIPDAAAVIGATHEKQPAVTLLRLPGRRKREKFKTEGENQ